MTKTIELTEVVISKITLDYTAQCVKVDYVILDAEGYEWEKGVAIFWVNLPAEPTRKDFQLPPSYFPTLLQLQTDADTALTNRFLM